MGVCALVAVYAKRDEIVFPVSARVAAKLLMMDLQILHGAAGLTMPAVTLEDLLPQYPAGLLIEAKRPDFGERSRSFVSFTHDAFG